MYLLYILPYNLLYGLFGFFGGAIALFILALGVLRFLFLIVLVLTWDMPRFKSEITEGWPAVREKFKAAGRKIASFFN